VISHACIVAQLRATVSRGEHVRTRARQLCGEIAEVIDELRQSVRHGRELLAQARARELDLDPSMGY
jgi:uncharacterized protein (UPF0335 family)